MKQPKFLIDKCLNCGHPRSDHSFFRKGCWHVTLFKRPHTCDCQEFREKENG